MGKNDFIFYTSFAPKVGQILEMPINTTEILIFTSTTNPYDYMPTFITKTTLEGMKKFEQKFRLLCASLAHSPSSNYRHLIVFNLKSVNPITFHLDNSEDTVGLIYVWYR